MASQGVTEVEEVNNHLLYSLDIYNVSTITDVNIWVLCRRSRRTTTNHHQFPTPTLRMSWPAAKWVTMTRDGRI